MTAVATPFDNQPIPESGNASRPPLWQGSIPERAGTQLSGSPAGLAALWKTARLVALAGTVFSGISTAWADAPSEAVSAERQALLKKTFDEKITPFVTSYCIECHGDKVRKGGITFRSALKNPGAPNFRKQWKQASASVKAHEMPPDDAKKQPSPEEAGMFADWVKEMKHLSPRDPGYFVIRRLNKVEYANTLRDLLGTDPKPARELPEEVFGAGYLNSLSPMLMEQYLAIAGEVLDSVWAAGAPLPGALGARLFGANPPEDAGNVEGLRAPLWALARRAFRRPAVAEELDVLLSVFSLARKAGRTFDDSLRLVVKAVLVSPQFLFITPESAAEPDTGVVPLDDFQLAARLSYLLWSAPPDATLSALADAGTLREPGMLAQQTRRLLSDPRSRALFDGFGAQWLGVGRLAGKTFDTAKFPQMNAELRGAMYDEARLLFESIVRENLSLVGFVDCDYTFLNGTLAHIYGMEGDVWGPEMRKVRLRNPNRGGILGMPGVLAATSFPNRTSPVNRGVWVLEQVLGEHVPPAPPNVPALDRQDKAGIANLTLRQRTELHRKNAVCMNCHKILDPIGFGLENFDAIGRWREEDENGGAIDAAGELPGAKRFSTPGQLKAILAARADDFGHNLAEKMLAYALGRQLEGYDEIVLDRVAEAVAMDGYKMQTLIVQIVGSYPFTHRRVREQKEDPNGKKLAH